MIVSDGEFDIIRKFFAPLSKGVDGAYALTDDAALVAGGDFIVTADMMIEGVHFLKNTPLDLAARKLIRVNLSDLAAKGAKPIGYFLTCAWPHAANREDIAHFAKGLEADQEEFRVALYGGDTTRHQAAKAPLTLSATFFGSAPRQGMIRREGAAPGDDIYVSGTIGDAGLGLAALKKQERFSTDDRDFLIARYRLPEPRITLGGALAGVASAAIDVSDGLIADTGHIAETSQCAIDISAPSIPLSEAARTWRDGQESANAAYGRLAAGGDDYEILFSAPPRARRAVEMAATLSKTPVARIGVASRGAGVRLLDAEGEEILVEHRGYDHFSDR